MKPSSAPIAIVYGTRPEAIKLGPVVAALRDAQEPHIVYCTGQHTTLLADSPARDDLGFAVALDLPSDGNVTSWHRRASAMLAQHFADNPPTLVLVQGDTMSAFAGARAAATHGIPIAHLEAGLRSGTIDEPWPEELFRRRIDALASLWLAPTDHAKLNLLAEGCDDHKVVVTGNTVIAAMDRYWERPKNPNVFQRILVTLHRRELRADPQKCRDAMHTLYEAMATETAREYDFVWPVHPAMEEFMPPVAPENLILRRPMDYAQLLTELTRCTGVLTDSGGIVEEAATLGVPTVILRKRNDRPEAVAAGVAAQVAPTPGGMHLAVKLLTLDELRPKRRPTQVYGTARSAVMVVNILREYLHGTT